MKKRNGEIELFRFVFAVLVWLRHGTKLFVGERFQNLFTCGALAVDFFFIVSGYLMTVTCAKHCADDQGKCDLGKETAGFIIRKYFGLMPEYLVAWIFAFVLYLFGLDEINLSIFVREAVAWLFELIPLSMTGLSHGVFHNALWYISAMLMAMAVLYPLCRRYFSFFTRIGAPLITVFLMGFFELNYGTTLDQQILIGSSLYKGFLRGISGICFGAALYPAVEKIKDTDWTPAGRKTISTVILLNMLFIVYRLLFSHNSDLDIFTVILMGVTACLAFSHQGCLADRFDNKICYFLGKYSLLLYLCHSETARFIKIMYRNRMNAGLITLSTDKCSLIMWGLYLVMTVLTMAAVHFISEYLRKHQGRIEGLFASGKQ